MARDQRGNEVPTVKYHQESDPKDIQGKWWNVPAPGMWQHAIAVARQIRQAQNYREVNNLKFARLYQNADIQALKAGQFATTAAAIGGTNRLSYNIIKSCVDTAASKIAKQKPRPLFLTDDGDWTLQRKAMKLTAFMEGAFDCMGSGTGDGRTLYGVMRRAWVDAAVLGTGAVKFYADQDEGTVKAERCLIEEIVVDETDGMYEAPRQLHQEKLLDRRVLVDLVPSKFRDLVMAAPTGLDLAVSSTQSADVIKVTESWHLPSSKDAKDGRKALSIEGATLDVSDWQKQYAPFVFHRWSPRLLGFYGMGLAEELMPIQLEINKLLRTIAKAQHLIVPQVWLEMANKVNAKQLDNEVAGAKYFVGQPPIFMAPSAVNPELYQHLETLWNKGFAITGISQLSAASQKPGGLNAAVALREFQDIESDRFQLVGQRYEDSFMDATHIVCDLMEDLEASGVKPKVRLAGEHGSRQIKWADVKIDRDKVRIRAFPTNILPSQPAGKLQKVQELMQAGFLQKEEAVELLDFPDLKSQTSLTVAPRQDIKRMIEAMMDGEYESPEPFMNLELGKQMAQSYYLRGRANGMPEDRLELLRRFMDDCKALLEKPAAPPAPAAPEAGPMAQPAPQPTSDLLPVA